MTRVRNADEFVQNFRRAKSNYDRIYSPLIAEVRRQYAQRGSAPPSSVDESLEAHNRIYVINTMLEALNWRLNTSVENGLPNLLPETPVRSIQRRTVRFLDYLGFERAVDRPLVIIEVKRPSEQLPKLVKLADSPSYAEVISRGLAGGLLAAEWNKWLNDLADYVRSVTEQTGRTPRRVVLTNGKWLILFLDPYDAFLEDGKRSASRILVFENQHEIENRAMEVFRHLEHQRVLGETHELEPGELLFFVLSSEICRVMHGLHLWYYEDPGGYKPRPAIKVAPVLFLQSHYGAWLRLEIPTNDYPLPHRRSELQGHLTEVDRAAQNLLRDISDRLGRHFVPTSLSVHYEQEGESFTVFPGVQPHYSRLAVASGMEEYIVMTGDKTHYLMPEPTVQNCPYHDWVKSNAEGKASGSATHSPMVYPRSFFCSPEVHHCSHRDVKIAKSTQITAGNRDRCGNRSGEEGQAFCEIYRFETHLCCRTCVFEDVCTKANEVFILPCRRTEG